MIKKNAIQVKLVRIIQNHQKPLAFRRAAPNFV